MLENQFAAAAREEVRRRLLTLDYAYSTTFHFHGDWEPYGLRMACDFCGDIICRVAAGNTTGGLLNAIRDHNCARREPLGSPTALDWSKL